MKIEIDLNDIIVDGDFTESVQDSIRRQVVENLTKTFRDGIGRKINEEISKVVNDEIKKVISEKMPSILDSIMEMEYTTVSEYGEVSKQPTNLRLELLKAIQAQMVYKKSHYGEDKNIFTKTVDALVAKQVDSFKAEFNKHVDAEYTKEVLLAATSKLKQKLGIST